MTIIAEAFVRIRPDDKDFPKQVVTSAQKAADKGGAAAAKTMTQHFQRAGRESHVAFLSAFSHFGEEFRARFLQGIQFGVGAFTGIEAFRGLEAVFAEGYKSENIFQTTTAQLNSVLKSTHGIAGESAEAVNRLSERVASYSGETVNAVRNSQVMLLGFTNIRDVAGKNNDIFRQSAVLAEDLSKRYGIDVSQAARTLGRALNDPSRGLLLLRRAGIQLTSQQADQAKKFADAGKILEAQKVILAAVRDRVGGAADAYGKTLPGQVARAREQFNEFSRSVEEKTLPAILRVGTSLLTFAHNHAPQVERAFSRVGKVMSSGVATAVPIVQRVLATLQPVVADLVQSFRNLGTILQPLAGPALKALAVTFGVALTVARALGAGIAAVTGFLKDHRTAVYAVTAGLAAFAATLAVVTLVSKFGAAIELLTGVVKGLRGGMLLLNIVLDANPFIAIAAVVIGLAAAFITAWKTSATFRDGVKSVFADIEHAVGVAISAIINAFRLWADAQLKVFSVIANGTAAALGWVPVLGPQLKKSVSDFDQFRAGVDTTLQGIANDAYQLGNNTGSNFASGFGAGISGAGAFKDPAFAKIFGPAAKQLFSGDLGGLAKYVKHPKPQTFGLSVAPASSPDFTPDTKTKDVKTVIARAVPVSLTAASVIKALQDAVAKGRPGVLAELTKLASQIRVTLNSSAAHGARDQIVEMLDQRRKALGSLADQYVTITKKIDDATKRLTDAQQAQADFFSNLQDTFTSAGNLANVLQGLSDQVTPGGEAVGGFLQHQVNQLDAFLSNLDALKAKGLSPELIKQLATQGADQGGRIAAGLVGASQAQIARIDALQAQLASRAASGAQQLSNDFYQAGVDQLKTELTNDRKELAKISAAITNLEKRIGDDVGRGVAAGLDAVAKAANHRARAKTAQSASTTRHRT